MVIFIVSMCGVVGDRSINKVHLGDSVANISQDDQGVKLPPIFTISRTLLKKVPVYISLFNQNLIC